MYRCYIYFSHIYRLILFNRKRRVASIIFQRMDFEISETLLAIKELLLLYYDSFYTTFINKVYVKRKLYLFKIDLI